MADTPPPVERRSDFWLRLMVAGTVCVAVLVLIIGPQVHEPSREVSQLINTAWAVVGLLIGNIVKPLFPGSMPNRTANTPPDPAP